MISWVDVKFLLNPDYSKKLLATKTRRQEDTKQEQIIICPGILKADC